MLKRSCCPGNLYSMLLRERLEDCLQSIKAQVLLDVRLHPSKVDFSTDRYFRQVLDVQKDIGKALQYFLVTGNLVSPSGLDLMQTSGFTIVAERLNYYRYISHYRSVHRGQFFTTMKTTDVRKLLPESFGFFCPGQRSCCTARSHSERECAPVDDAHSSPLVSLPTAHTPDGAPCGLLNHFTARTTVLTEPSPISQRALLACLVGLGLQTTAEYPLLPYTHLPVILDGLVVGRVHPAQAAAFVQALRLLKVQGHPAVYRYLEIYAILDTADQLFPAVQLYTTPARVMRPVRYLGESVEASPIEWIGSQEQITMEIAITDVDYREKETTHQELSAASMLSVVASMTPFSDFNQSPRNMYQVSALAAASHSEGGCPSPEHCSPHAPVRRCVAVSDGQADDGHSIPRLSAPRGQQGVPHPEPPVAHSAQRELRALPRGRLPHRHQRRRGRARLHRLRHGGRLHHQPRRLRPRLQARLRLQVQAGGPRRAPQARRGRHPTLLQHQPQPSTPHSPPRPPPP